MRADKQVGIDPIDAPAVQSALTNEGHNVLMWNGGRLTHQRVVCPQRRTPSLVAHQEFAKDEGMAAHFSSAQQLVEPVRVGRSIGQEPNPDGGINEDQVSVG